MINLPKNAAAILAAVFVLSVFYSVFPVQTVGNLTGQAAQAKHGHTGVVGEYTFDDFDPMSYLKSWNFNDLPEKEREKFYKEQNLSDGTMLREYWIYAIDKKIEVAPGVFFDAWTYSGKVPGPTIRATEGDTIRVHLINQGSHAHTAHFHGYHEASMDGAMPEQFVQPGESFIYEFKAGPVGLHLYHCHVTPLKAHIAQGMYAMFIVDPVERREPANELIMMMNAFDTNFDGENEVYAVNTKAFYYVNNTIKAKVGELVRIYVANMVEFDPVNSIHIHGNFFNEYQTGTLSTPSAFTDIIQLGQAERSILELRFKFPGKYMFHAHQTEFSELGWMGFFEVEP
ncbi:MAG: multicopper oxidase domain-containing protein [Candidatus Aenigmarchaeota archaeon]|nr:multicopper oxidase domain-containing protein [Candidatus Aenigmarchaeota archaeon]